MTKKERLVIFAQSKLFEYVMPKSGNDFIHRCRGCGKTGNKYVDVVHNKGCKVKAILDILEEG